MLKRDNSILSADFGLPDRPAKVVVAMSGGVDSSVAAALLKRAGHDVVGVFMRLGSDDAVEQAQGYDNTTRYDSKICRTKPATGQGDAEGLEKGRSKAESASRETASPAYHTGSAGLALPQAAPKAHKQGCCSVNDADDARLVAAMLDIPLYVLNFKRDFGRIIDYFTSEYHAGRTPNPCVRCNDWLKFGKLFDYADSIDAQYVATGHYARISGQWPQTSNPVRPSNRSPITGHRSPTLLRGLDPAKDQSYVLFGTRRDRLARMLLPIGHTTKQHTRELAEAWELPVFNKPDSQEICFVPDQDYAGLVRRRDPDRVREGAIVDTAGRVLGTHAGHQHFTLGQRRGLGLSHPTPLYVVDKDPDTNVVTVGDKADLRTRGCTADQANWLTDEPPAAWRRCTVKVRYNAQPVPGEVRATGDDTLEARFDDPVEAVAPGQAIVCYDGDTVLGGGWIRAAMA